MIRETSSRPRPGDGHDSIVPAVFSGPLCPPTRVQMTPSSLTLGVKFTTSVSGFVSGIRFYKGAGNVGTHTGTLYRADGTVLSSVTFANETATGWQTASFPSAVAILTGTTYIASYTDPNGHYASASSFFTYKGLHCRSAYRIGWAMPNPMVFTEPPPGCPRLRSTRRTTTSTWFSRYRIQRR